MVNISSFLMDEFDVVFLYHFSSITQVLIHSHSVSFTHKYFMISIVISPLLELFRNAFFSFQSTMAFLAIFYHFFNSYQILLSQLYEIEYLIVIDIGFVAQDLPTLLKMYIALIGCRVLDMLINSSLLIMLLKCSLPLLIFGLIGLFSSNFPSYIWVYHFLL